MNYDELKKVLSRMAYTLCSLCLKLKTSYGVTKNLVMVQIELAIIRAIAKRLRGIRKQFNLYRSKMELLYPK